MLVEAKTTLNSHDVDVFLAKPKKFKKSLPKLAYKRVIYGAIAYLGIADESPEILGQKHFRKLSSKFDRNAPLDER